MTGTHMIIEEPWTKEKALLMMEANHCPCCKTRDILAVRELDNNFSRNHYYCRVCGTQWYGNIFDSQTYKMKQCHRKWINFSAVFAVLSFISVFLIFVLLLLL